MIDLKEFWDFSEPGIKKVEKASIDFVSLLSNVLPKIRDLEIFEFYLPSSGKS